MIITGSQSPKERLSLSLSAKLVNGTIKILNKQVLFLQGKNHLSHFFHHPNFYISFRKLKYLPYNTLYHNPVSIKFR